MIAPDRPVFETWISRERRHVTLSEADYRLWLRRIREDGSLMRALRDIRDGRTPLLDLDEGGAGIFPRRLLPAQVREELLAKLDHIGDAGARHVFFAFLLSKVLSELGVAPSPAP